MTDSKKLPFTNGSFLLLPPPGFVSAGEETSPAFQGSDQGLRAAGY
jgi:hypothetical protein